MTKLGGFLELELVEGSSCQHPTAVSFATGRTCLHALLRHARPRHVYVPFYTCDALLEPFVWEKVPYTFYSLNENLEPRVLPDLQNNEYFLYINYFGLMDKTVESLADHYGDKLIVDATQAFFFGAPRSGWAFNSARKFLGVPDGAYLYSPEAIQQPNRPHNQASYLHLVERIQGDQLTAYGQFQSHEASLGAIGPQLLAPSILSKRLLSNIDYKEVSARRIANYTYLHQELGRYNQLNLPIEPAGAPLCYPLLASKKIERQPLFKQDIFIPTYWQDCLVRQSEVAEFEFEKRLSLEMLPLPLDQRYTPIDLVRMVNALFSLFARSHD